MIYSREQARLNLISALRLVESSIKLSRRDKREPGRREKMELEDRLQLIVLRHFNKQKRKVVASLREQYPDRKAMQIDQDVFEDEDFFSQLFRLLTEAVQKGISLFSTLIKPQVDWTLTNKEAAEWARQYTFDLVKGIDQTTRETLQSAISQFVSTPGMTIGDVTALLPFSEARAGTVAVTEITRAYAQSNLIAGKELQKQFPGVKVIKMWTTNNDDLVCDICAPLDGMIVDIEHAFTTVVEDRAAGLGLDGPPAHVNCRCWITTTTALGEEDITNG